MRIATRAAGSPRSASGGGSERRTRCRFTPARRRSRRFEPGAHYPTFAWKLAAGGRTAVYASDVARLTPGLRHFSGGANLLVIDGAMWRRRLFSHLTIDAELPRLCEWRVDRILLTQIGSTAPPHEELEHAVAARCPRGGVRVRPARGAGLMLPRDGGA